jgi:hypothetical protein
MVLDVPVLLRIREDRLSARTLETVAVESLKAEGGAPCSQRRVIACQVVFPMQNGCHGYTILNA